MNRKLLSLFLLLFLIVGGATSAWAETSTLTFTAKCNGSGTADDDVAWTVTSDGTESNFDNTKGIHYGTSSAQVKYIQLSTSGISGTITKVVVNASVASGVSASVSVSVGGSAFGGDAKSVGTSATNYTFEGSASGEIVVKLEKPSKAAKALYVKSVEVTYTTGGGDTPTLKNSDLALTGAPIALSFDLYNNSSAQVINYTTSSTGDVTIAESDYATFSINETDKTITVTPKTAVTQSAQTITVNQAADDDYKAGSATFTLTITNSTPYTVTFSDDNSEIQASKGDAVDLPSRSDIGGYTFAGWSNAPVAPETTTAPTSILTGNYIPADDITLYPVYKRIEGDGGPQNMSANVTLSAYATANSWISGTQYTSVTIDENVTAAVSNGGGNTGKYYSNGSWRFYPSESGEFTISTTSGELTSITITYTGNTLTYGDDNVTSGTAISVSGTSASFSVSGSSSNSQITAISVEYSIEGSGATYYVSAPAQANLTDANDITELASAAGHGCVVTYTRSFTDGKASTVCLPFDYTKKEGDGSFYEFTGIEQNGEGEYVATMTEPGESTLEAKKPYLYLPNGDDEVNFGGTYAIPSDLTAGSYTSGDWTFKGTFETIEWASAPAGTYGFSAQDKGDIYQGEFVKVGNYVRIKPMRCYLQYTGDDSQWAGVRGKNRVAAKMPETIKVRLVGADGTVTAIGSLSTTTGEMTMDGAWYSINGTRLNGTPATKGIYVRNGKKVVIK